MKELNESVSKNFNRGLPVISVTHLIALEKRKESIYHVNYGVKPAALINSMQVRAVMKMLDNHLIFRTRRKVK